jgi:hypothetical protein
MLALDYGPLVGLVVVLTCILTGDFLNVMRILRGDALKPPEWARVSTFVNKFRVPASRTNRTGRRQGEEPSTWLKRCCAEEYPSDLAIWKPRSGGTKF